MDRMDSGQQSENDQAEPTASDWKRAKEELNPPPSEEFPTQFVLLMAVGTLPAAILILIWLFRQFQ